MWSRPYLCTASSRGCSPPLHLCSHARSPPLCSAAVCHQGPSAPTAFVRRPDPMLPPQAPPSPRGAHRPHHQQPQPLPRVPVARSPPSSFLHALTDNRPLRPSAGPIPALASTTPPRSTMAPFQLWIFPASPTPHRCSPTLIAIAVVSQAAVSPLSV
jgi:hypothetical protein